jgi:hypothetical protein
MVSPTTAGVSRTAGILPASRRLAVRGPWAAGNPLFCASPWTALRAVAGRMPALYGAAARRKIVRPAITLAVPSLFHTTAWGWW